MIAHWMLYCVAVGVILALGAAAAERALAVSGRPVRGAWAAALLLTLAFPVGVRLLPRPAPDAAPAPVRVIAPAAGSAASAPAGAPAVAPARRQMDLRALDRPLLAGWAASSALALAVLAAMGLVLERRRRGWREATVDGVPVLVSPDTGPAVVGLIRGRIVIPEWACAADEEARALMLEHEGEHLRAGDPRLLAGALLVAALMPWNPAVWWQLRRLRLAVEVDCDARVLRRGGDVRAYGALLLEMGRRAGASRLAVVAFSEPASFLERRIRAMTAPRLRFAGLRAAGFGALAAALIAAACETPGPVQVAPAAMERVQSAPGERGARPRVDPRALVARHYPEVLTEGAGDGATITFVFSPGGEVLGHALNRDPRPEGVSVERDTVVMPRRVGSGLSEREFTDEIEDIDVVRFNAGQMGPDPVRVALVWAGAPRFPAGPGAGTPPPAPRGVPLSVLLREDDSDEPRAQLTPGLMEKHWPTELPEGDSGRVSARFVLDAAGRARDVSIQGQPHPALAEAARRVFGEMVFHPAKEGHPMRMTLVFEKTSGPPSGPTIQSNTVLLAAFRERFPDAASGGDYWLVADARGRVIRSGRGLGRELDATDYGTVDYTQTMDTEVRGQKARIIWIQLKP